MATTLKKCLKLHKLFMAEVTRSLRLESEGFQVLSSLVNVSQRVPILLQSSSANDHDDIGNVKAIGVLSYSSNTQTLLLQKHFLALEKSRGFLNDIMREYQDLLQHLRSFVNECVTLVLEVLDESENVVSVEDEMAVETFPLQLQEWMENVLTMYEYEVLRKTRLVADLEYSEPGRLSAVHKQWSFKGAMGNVNSDYVQTGLRMPQLSSSSALQTNELESIVSKRKTKKKKSKARK